MKICPDCQERYDDDVGVCPKDGEDLVELPRELSGNPKLPEPVAAAPGDRTSMIDLEAIEAKRKAKQRPTGDGADEKTPPPEEPLEADGDATGTLRRERPKKKDPTQQAAIEDEEEVAADEYPPDRRVGEELTDRELSRRSRISRVSRTAVAEGTATRTRRTQVAPPPKRVLSGMQATALVGVALVALVGGIVVVARATAVLTVTTVPPGASVLLDSVPVGMSPLQKRVRTGSHVVELTLDGYEAYKEVVDVPAGGLPFLQPLQKKPPPPPPPPTAAQIAGEMARAAAVLLESGDLDGAHLKLDEAHKLAPDDPEVKALLPKVAEAIAKRDATAGKQEAAAERAARLQKARVLLAEGRAEYERGALGPAKEKLYASLKLDAQNPEPHRTLGRIFNREDDVDKVRYHLQRYLDLGGADGDFKVREWLKTHPK